MAMVKAKTKRQESRKVKEIGREGERAIALAREPNNGKKKSNEIWQLIWLPQIDKSNSKSKELNCVSWQWAEQLKLLHKNN